MKLWYRSVLLLVDSPEDRGDADDYQQEKPREMVTVVVNGRRVMRMKIS